MIGIAIMIATNAVSRQNSVCLDGNVTPEKARKSRQMQFHDKTAYVWMGMLPLKKRVNRDKCSFATKQRMFGVFAIDEILRYRGSRIPGSPTSYATLQC